MDTSTAPLTLPDSPPDIEHWFHPKPPTPDQAKKYLELHNRARDFALFLESLTPEPNEEKSLALVRVQEVVHWGESTIARHAGATA